MDAQARVLAGIIPDRRDHLLWALQRLEPEHFPNLSYRSLFLTMEGYYRSAAGVVDLQAFHDMAQRQNIEPTKRIAFEQLFAEVQRTKIPDHVFRWAVDHLRQVRAHQLTGETITRSMEILVQNEVVRTSEGKELNGHEGAIQYALGEFGRIRQLGLTEEAPEGDIRDDKDEMLTEYADRKHDNAAGRSSGVETGIASIDQVTAGFQPGEMVLVCGYTGQGKSHLVTQTAWDAAFRQNRNVLVFTSETVRSQVRRRLIARHSRLPAFNRVDGLNTTDIKNARLTPEDELIYHHVIDDMTSNPDYGRCHIAQVPRGATLNTIEAWAMRQQAEWNVEMIVIDYLALLRPETRRESQVHEYAELLRDAKVFATTFDAGRGVPLVSPWQMQQDAYRSAMKTGAYTLASLSETSEAEKSSDQIIAILRTEEEPNKLKMQFLKNRDGDIPPQWQVDIDYRCSFLGESGPQEFTPEQDLLEGVVV